MLGKRSAVVFCGGSAGGDGPDNVVLELAIWRNGKGEEGLCVVLLWEGKKDIRQVVVGDRRPAEEPNAKKKVPARPAGAAAAGTGDEGKLLLTAEIPR